MKSDLKKRTNILIILALVLIPFDAVPHIFPSDYRPISLIFLLPLVGLIMAKALYTFRLEKTTFYLVLAYLFFTTLSLLLTFYKGFNPSGFLDYFVTFSIGVATFAVFRYGFSKIRKNSTDNDDYVLYTFRYLLVGYFLMVIIGLVEFFSANSGLLPYDVKVFLNNVVGGRSTFRLQLTSSEPAWAARQVLFGLPVLLITRGKKNLWTIIMLLLLLMTFSIEGFLVLILSFTIYYIYKAYNIRSNVLSRNIKYLIGSLLIFFMVLTIGKRWLFDQNRYFYERIDKLTSLEVLKVDYAKAVYLDESMFVRIAYPLLGIHMFLDNPIFGVGGGNYRNHFNDYLKRDFPLATKLNFRKVEHDLRFRNHQGKNLYTRILGEFGIFGALLFIMLIRTVFVKINAAEFRSPNIRQYLMLWLIISLVAFLQFDSFSYINFWLLTAFLFSLTPAVEQQENLEKLEVSFGTS